MNNAEAVERFWRSVDKTDPGACWLWTGGVNPGGYGKFSVANKHAAAHRFSWQLQNGPIPAGMFVCHHCDVPACVNPAHLFLGTPKDNMDDKVRKKRLFVPSGDAHWSRRRPDLVARGKGSGNSKVSEADVLAMRADTTSTLNELSARFGLTISTISMIRTRRIWKHLP